MYTVEPAYSGYLGTPKTVLIIEVSLFVLIGLTVNTSCTLIHVHFIFTCTLMFKCTHTHIYNLHTRTLPVCVLTHTL